MSNQSNHFDYDEMIWPWHLNPHALDPRNDRARVDPRPQLQALVGAVGDRELVDVGLDNNDNNEYLRIFRFNFWDSWPGSGVYWSLEWFRLNKYNDPPMVFWAYHLNTILPGCWEPFQRYWSRGSHRLKGEDLIWYNVLLILILISSHRKQSCDCHWRCWFCRPGTCSCFHQTSCSSCWELQPSVTLLYRHWL